MDTEANVQVVDRKVIKYRKLEHKNDLYLETANNSELKMLGISTIQTEIGKILINHKIIVVDNLCNWVLIGLDVIKTLTLL